MSRVQARLRVVSVIALTLVLAGSPAAWAAPRAKSTATTVSAASWVDAATAWFAGLFDRLARTETNKNRGVSATSGAVTYVPGGGGGSTTQSGSCIDPLGGNKCNV